MTSHHNMITWRHKKWNLIRFESTQHRICIVIFPSQACANFLTYFNPRICLKKNVQVWQAEQQVPPMHPEKKMTIKLFINFLSPPVPMHGGLICITFRLYGRHWTKSARKKTRKKSISLNILQLGPKVMKFGQGLNIDDPKVDLEGQGHQLKKCAFGCLDSLTGNAQGQRAHAPRPKVTWVNVSIKVMILADGLTSTSSCFIGIRFSSKCWSDDRNGFVAEYRYKPMRHTLV